MNNQPDLHFRLARADDIAAMSAIRLAVTENVLSDPAKVTLRMYRDYMETLGRAWVCEADGEVVGFCYAASGDASIWALFVDRQFEGLGIATGLLETACQWLQEIGKRHVVLSTAAGTRADRFYMARGWQRDAPDVEGDVRFTKSLAPRDR